jgi:hypothetical protein
VIVIYVFVFTGIFPDLVRPVLQQYPGKPDLRAFSAGSAKAARVGEDGTVLELRLISGASGDGIIYLFMLR